jgi:hypothetical protein
VRDARVSIIVRVPVSSIGEEIRGSHGISQEFSSADLEGTDLVLRFGEAELRSRPVLSRPYSRGQASSNLDAARRRRHSARNRMKTRGWNVVTKMTNSKGQTVAIYEPFVLALRGQKLTRSEQRKRVVEVLRENGNRPGPVSVDYYLSNTLEFLQKAEEP